MFYDVLKVMITNLYYDNDFNKFYFDMFQFIPSTM